MPIGTLINTIAIIAGSLIGLLLHNAIPDKIKKIVFQSLGLSTLLIGTQMALKVENIITVIFSLLIGAIIGEILSLEKRTEHLGDFLKRRTKSKNEQFTEGFVAASLLFCIGAMAILGSINEGITGDKTILYTKSILDGFAAIALAATYGIGVLFSSLIVLLYQGSITLLAGNLQGILTQTVINQITAVGGLLIVGIGINLLEIKKIHVTNMLPALVIIILLTLLF